MPSMSGDLRLRDTDAPVLPACRWDRGVASLVGLFYPTHLPFIFYYYCSFGLSNLARGSLIASSKGNSTELTYKLRGLTDGENSPRVSPNIMSNKNTIMLRSALNPNVSRVLHRPPPPASLADPTALHAVV